MNNIRKYQLCTYASGNNYLSIDSQGVFSFSANISPFIFIPTGQPNQVKISVCGIVANALNVYLIADTSRKTVGLGPLHPNNEKAILWTIESIPNESDSFTAYYSIKSALSNGDQAYYLNGMNSDSLNLISQLSVKEAPGAFWKINELIYIKKGKAVIQFGSTPDPGSLVLNSDGRNVFLSSLQEYLISPWNWEIVTLPQGLLSYITLNNSVDNSRLYLTNEKGSTLVSMGEQGPAACWMIYSNNLFTVVSLNWGQGQPSLQYLIGNTGSKTVEASAACSNPPANATWIQYQTPTPEPPTDSTATFAIGGTESVIMDAQTLQHLALHISEARACFIFSDKNALKIIHEIDTASGFAQATVTPPSGKFLYGWALNDQNLYLLNDQRLESYDLSTIEKTCLAGQLFSDGSPIPVKKSLDLGNGNQYAAPVFDNNNAYIFVLRNDGNVYGFPENFGTGSPTVCYDNSKGAPPATPLELFIESKPENTHLYFLNANNDLMKFKVDYSSETIVVVPYLTPKNLPVDVLVKRYWKGTASNPTQKSANNWSQVEAFNSNYPAYVLDGSSATVPYMLFAHDNPMLQASFAVLLAGGPGTSFPNFDFTSGTISDPNTEQAIKVAVYTLQNADGVNVKMIGCPLVKYNVDQEKFEIYALTSELSAPQHVKLRKFVPPAPTQTASLFLENWALMAGSINNTFLSQQRKKASLIQNSTFRYNACVKAFSASGGPVSPNTLLYQQNMLDNFYESVTPTDIQSHSSIMSQWLKFASIQQLADG